MEKIRIGVLFGGRSAEHEISLISGYNVMKALDHTKYDIFPIGISKTGEFYHFANDAILNIESPTTVTLATGGEEIFFSVGGFYNPKAQAKTTLDVVFPVLHGTYGEDGTIQGMLEIMDLPYVGTGVLGSAVGMDKDIMKKILRDAGITIGKFLTVTSASEITFEKATEALGLPLFVKPANAGSSVGISKVHDESEYMTALEEAFKFDNKVLVEETIVGQEIEVSVMGNEKPEASLPGKVTPTHEFYDYDAKYLDENGATFEIPAKLSDQEIANVQEVAIKAYKALSAEGMSRVDGFLTPEGKFMIIEINTIPGFTKISMYPKLWEVSGLPYSQLLDKLVKLAIDRAEKRNEILTNYSL
ncbi:MAG: D-alanine--D-alanine ligase family protein [Patescibacteria group bacterium]|jgi:D-alanine-D-alanine ligase